MQFPFFFIQGGKGVPSGRFFTITFLPLMASASKACRVAGFVQDEIGDVDKY